MDEPFSRVSGFFDNLVAEHGEGPRALDYASLDAQATRFRVLGDVGPLAGRRILDVGCGFADWASWLEAHVGDVKYEGIDLSPAMVAEARRRHPDRLIRVGNVLDGDVTGTYDVVAANGIFYLLGPEGPRLMQELVVKMFDLATDAVVFTSLSTWGSAQEPNEFYADPVETLAFCRSLTPWVVLRHDYHERDFAVYLYREARR